MNTGGAVKEAAQAIIGGLTFGLAFWFTNQYAVLLTDRGIYYRPNAVSCTATPFHVRWSRITDIVDSEKNINVIMNDGSIVQISDTRSESTGLQIRLHPRTIAAYLQRILQEYNQDVHMADKFRAECESLLRRESCNDDIFTFCNSYEARLSELPEYTQSIVIKGLIKLYFKLLDKHCNTTQLIVTKIENLCRNHLEIFHENNTRWNYQKINKDIFAFWGILQSYKPYIEEKYIGLQRLRQAIDCEGEFVWADERIANQTFEDLVRSVVDNFMSIDANKRLFLVIDSNMSYLTSDNFVVLPRQHAQKTLCFPLHHPQEHELYICHPYNHNLYIPYESCEFELFKDKMDELRLVLQAMGATSIKIYDANDSETHKNSKRNTEGDGSFDAKINKANGSLKHEKESDEFEKLRREYETESVFEPQRMPYIPDNLVWYPHQTDWQRLFEQRKGGLKRHRISLSIAEEIKFSEQKRLALKADFQALILKMNVGVNVDTDSMFETKTSSAWTLDVEFASLEELRARENMANNINIAPIQPAIPIAELTDEEQKYIEKVKFCFEDDGQMDLKERRMLDRFRLRFGISGERATELEKMVMGNVEDGLSAEEQEYCDVVSDYASDGELSESDLRLLARLASSLGITPEREKELQIKYTKK